MRPSPRRFTPCQFAAIVLFTAARLAHAQSTTGNNTLIYEPQVPFHFAMGPENAPAMVIAQIKQIAGTGMPRVSAALATASTLQVWPPIQSYTFDLQGLAVKGEFLPQPLRGLIYLVEDSGETLAFTDVGPSLNPRSSGQLEVGSIAFSSGSWRAPELASSIFHAANFPQVSKRSFEVRSLSNPPLNFLEAVWLKSLDGGPDYVYPYHLPSNSVLKPNTLYPLAEYLKLLQPLAQKRLLEIAKMQPGMGG
jgi:hypothetical protein